MHILTNSQAELLKDERQALNELQVLLIKFDADPEDQKSLVESINQLDQLFLLVVVGEFNSGKSAFINALIGQRILEEGVTPTTTQVNILKYGEIKERSVIDEGQHILYLPVEWLNEISVVDTPGTNAIIRSHEEITTQFVPRSDLVIFITSCDRPFTESERLFLQKIREWGKKIVFVINKIDLLSEEYELVKVHQYVSENITNMLGVKPEIFPVSSRFALDAKLGKPELWGESNFSGLEEYIHNSLDEVGRLKLKLLNPVGVGNHLSNRYLQAVESRLDLLKQDLEMIFNVESQLTLYKEDMQRDFEYRMADLENILYEMEKRGGDYFDELFRLARIFDLLSKDRISKEFEQRVVAETPQQIERKVNELIDWLVESDLRQWQAVNDYLAERRIAHKDKIVGESFPGSFHYDRERLINAVGREAQRVVDGYDKSAEAEAIAQGAQTAVAASAALEISAVGLGTLVAVLASTAAADITGILLASLVAVLGLFVIPARRRAAKAEMSEKISNMRELLMSTLRTQFENEIDHSMHKITDAIAPYTRFIRAEQESLKDAHSNLMDIKSRLIRMKITIENL